MLSLRACLPRVCGLAALLVALAVVSGCAARSSRFVKQGEPTATFDAVAAVAPQESLDDYARRLRSLQSMPRTKASLLPTIESTDRALAAALLALATGETPENHRRVASAYRGAGITDYAYRHYQRALRLDPCDSASHEGIARLWRDWGNADLGLGDAYRAIHCRPHSASAYNTLGTILLALGQQDNARRTFEFALRLDGSAAFALNNLCYIEVMQGDGASAQRTCERALQMDPALTAARTNLALAHAIQGNVGKAEQHLLSGADAAAAQYNVGMLRMSLGQYADAADAFERAFKAQPSMAKAARRAVQARAFAAAQREQ